MFGEMKVPKGVLIFFPPASNAPLFAVSVWQLMHPPAYDNILPFNKISEAHKGPVLIVIEKRRPNCRNKNFAQICLANKK